MRTPEEIKKGLEICTADESCRGCPYDNGNCDMQLERDALAYIQQLEAQQPRWISVGERLPEDDGYFLCYRNDGSPEVVCMYYGDGDFLTPEPELNNISHVITHWMPLPLPPEEE
jgi:hypothetical protein